MHRNPAQHQGQHSCRKGCRESGRAVQCKPNRLGHADKYVGTALKSEQMSNAYSLLNRNNEHLFYFKDNASGKRYLRFYGDAVEGDAGSEIVLRRQWEMPTFDGRPFIPFATNVTYDGWLILASTAGQMLAVKSDFSDYRFVGLVPRDRKIESTNAMQSFIRNGIAVDNNNGIYVVTQEFMARVQWTGRDFSLAAADGAWTARGRRNILRVAPAAARRRRWSGGAMKTGWW